MNRAKLCVGLMSGTSLDGIDAAVLRCADNGETALLATLDYPLSQPLRSAVAALCQPGSNEIEQLGVVDRQLGSQFAAATLALLDKAGLAAEQIHAIGSHGVTLRHRPASAGNTIPFTLQVGDPNTIAELTRITTVADFRRRDIAAGGEGAPLVPAFHAAVFGRSDETRAIVNIGGIANITLLHGSRILAGFDTGPGNTLLDFWASRHLGTPCDRGGAWGAEGKVEHELLEAMSSHPWLQRQGPRSTGKEMFSHGWLEQTLGQLPPMAPADVQATLAELTAQCIASGLRQSGEQVQAVYVCGGGARNDDLMRRLYRRLAPATLQSTAVLGIAPEWVEAAAFAWLAWRTLEGLPGNVPQATGAAGERILGGIYPGGVSGRALDRE